MHKIIGQVINLTKNIWLVEPTLENGFRAQFLVGKRSPFNLTSGFAISWWYTKISFRAVETIASMIIETMPEFKDCDSETAQKVLKETLQEICIEKSIFNGDDVCFSRRETLFECRSCDDINEYGLSVLNCILENLRNQLTTWCTIYTAPRISGPSFSITDTGLSIINRNDTDAWSNVLSRGYKTNKWDPLTGNHLLRDKTAFSILTYDYYFVCEESGTQEGAKLASMLKLRLLISVIFAVISNRSRSSLSKCGGKPHTTCLQFPGPKTSSAGITMSSIGELAPYYLNDHVLVTSDITDIQLWFAELNKLPNDQLSRVEKCAHFINKAMNSDDIESYINFFVALDALFGKRGSVEASIVAGVNSLELDSAMKRKTSLLFDLRNELVHGGSRYVKEWPKYRHYYKHFGSKPEQDIQTLAFTALLQSPNLLAKE